MVSDFEVDDVIGGRFLVRTPIEGLAFGTSIYSDDQTLERVGQAPGSQNYDVYGSQVEYLIEPWCVRSEYTSFDLGNGSFAAEGYYAEAAYRWQETWQLAIRYDLWDGDESLLDISLLPPFARQYFENKDVGLALSYWFANELVVRIEVHQIEGNRFAFPNSRDEVLQAFQTRQLEDSTALYVLGIQFSF